MTGSSQQSYMTDPSSSPCQQPSDATEPLTGAQSAGPIVRWVQPAMDELQRKIQSGEYAQDAKARYEIMALEFAAEFVPKATQVRIRKPPHVGGSDPNEPMHMTVTCKERNKAIGTYHIYTGAQ